MSVVETLDTVFLGVKPFFWLTFGRLWSWNGQPKESPAAKKKESQEIECDFRSDGRKFSDKGALWSLALSASLEMDFKSLVQEKKPEDRSARNGGSEAEGVRIA